MRVLITGGLGFIGGRLGHYLSESGVEVVLGTRKKDIKSPEWSPIIQVIQTHWNDLSSLENDCIGVDVVIHVAGMNATESDKNPAEALKVNGLNTANLLYGAISSGVKKFAYVSTGHVYNNPLQGDLSEGISPENLHPYASSHRAGEDIVRYANQQQLIKGIVIRLSNGYGPPIHKEVDCWTLLVNDLCRQAVEVGKIMLTSKGFQKRDFIPMTSVCKIICALISRDEQDFTDDLYNVGSGHSMSVWQMASLVKHRCEKVLDREIYLSRGSMAEINGEFRYNVEKLYNANINYKTDHNHEIDALVRFCVKNYS